MPKFQLIREKRFPNSTGGWALRDEDYEAPMQDRTVDAWIWIGGGYCLVNDGWEVIETVEAEDWDDLDWSYLVRPDSQSGWLSPSGRFTGCGYSEHDFVAAMVLKKEPSDMEQWGWVRIYGKTGGIDDWVKPGGRLTDDQRNWLSREGYVVSVDD